MRKWIGIIGCVVLCGAATLSSGCMGLSLFSSEHTHYHGGAELREKVDCVEKRMDALEQKTPAAADATKQNNNESNVILWKSEKEQD
jgi:hypothetical protein